MCTHLCVEAQGQSWVFGVLFLRYSSLFFLLKTGFLSGLVLFKLVGQQKPQQLACLCLLSTGITNVLLGQLLKCVFWELASTLLTERSGLSFFLKF